MENIKLGQTYKDTTSQIKKNFQELDNAKQNQIYIQDTEPNSVSLKDGDIWFAVDNTTENTDNTTK